MPDRALAIDLGSSSVRAIVFERSGPGRLDMVPGALARRLRHLDTSAPGQATFQPATYLADVVACVDELHAGGWLEGVTVVATDSQWHSVLVVAPDGHPMTDVVSWADTRAAHAQVPAAARLSQHPDQLEGLRQRTGCALAPMYWTLRIPWLVGGGGQVPPGGLFMGLAEYLGLCLLGDPAMSVSMASGTGLLASGGHDWDDEALEIAGVGPGALPELAPPRWCGQLTVRWARRWPALAGASWYPTLGDGAAANLGVGGAGGDRVAATVGTSAAVRAVQAFSGPNAPAVPPGLWRYCVDRDRAVTGAAYSSGGQLYSWALSLWEAVPPGSPGVAGGAAHAAGAVSHEVSYAIVPDVPAGSEGVVVVPWHTGTRPPASFVPAGSGAVLGLGLGHGGAHIVSASAEAVCFQLADGLAQLQASLPGPAEVVVNGGAIERSPWWQQRLASCLGQMVTVATVPETTARGAAAEALGVDLSCQGVEGHTVVPVGEDVAPLAAARRRWARACEGVAKLAW